MLDAFIIEELKRRERERQQRDGKRPTVEAPLRRQDDDEADRRSERDEAPRPSVVQIEL